MGLPRLPPAIMGTLPWLAMLTMLGLNAYQGYWAVKNSTDDTGGVWNGPLMPGKPLAVADRPKKVVVVEEGIKEQYADEPLRDMVLPDPALVEPVVGEFSDKALADAAAKKPLLRPTPPTPTPLEKPASARDSLKSGYIIQAGEFVLKLGTETLVKRLKDFGMDPFVEGEVNMVLLNSVQAGPYKSLEAAKEAEVKVKSAGLDSKVSETWEGFVVSLGKFYLLGYAMQSMEQAEKLNISPVRMVKVEVPLEVQKVFLGPFASRDQAKELSARIAQLGLAVPVIKEWKAKDPATGTGATATDGGKVAVDHPAINNEKSATPSPKSSGKVSKGR